LHPTTIKPSAINEPFSAINENLFSDFAKNTTTNKTMSDYGPKLPRFSELFSAFQVTVTHPEYFRLSDYTPSQMLEIIDTEKSALVLMPFDGRPCDDNKKMLFSSGLDRIYYALICIPIEKRREVYTDVKAWLDGAILRNKMWNHRTADPFIRMYLRAKFNRGDCFGLSTGAQIAKTRDVHALRLLAADSRHWCDHFIETERSDTTDFCDPADYPCNFPIGEYARFQRHSWLYALNGQETTICYADFLNQLAIETDKVGKPVFDTDDDLFNLWLLAAGLGITRHTHSAHKPISDRALFLYDTFCDMYEEKINELNAARTGHWHFNDDGKWLDNFMLHSRNIDRRAYAPYVDHPDFDGGKAFEDVCYDTMSWYLASTETDNKVWQAWAKDRLAKRSDKAGERDAYGTALRPLTRKEKLSGHRTLSEARRLAPRRVSNFFKPNRFSRTHDLYDMYDKYIENCGAEYGYVYGNPLDQRVMSWLDDPVEEE
jgi:hypothetical protein